MDDNEVYLDSIPETLVCSVCGKKSKVSKDMEKIFLLFDRYHLHCSGCNRVGKFIIKEQS